MNVCYKRMLIKLNDVWLFQYAYKLWLIDWSVFAPYRLYFSHLTSGILDINNVYIRFWINNLMIILFKKRLQILGTELIFREPETVYIKRNNWGFVEYTSTTVDLAIEINELLTIRFGDNDKYSCSIFRALLYI